MKLLNLNICIKINNTAEVISFIEKENPDIITLQEVVRPVGVGVFPQYKSEEGIRLALQKKYPYTFLGSMWVTEAFLKNGKVHRDLGGLAEMGNMVLSKWPLTFAENRHFYGHFEYAKDWTEWETKDHARSAVVSVIETPSGNIQIVNVHGIWTKDKQGDSRTLAECKYITAMAQERNMPTIIAGDFNLLPETPSIAILQNSYKNLITEYGIVSTRPNFNDGTDTGNVVVDYIFTNNKVAPSSLAVPEVEVSDHLPLVLDCEILA